MMISSDEESFEEVWVSSNYTVVFCTEEEKQRYLRFLESRKEIPNGMSIVIIKRRLDRRHGQKRDHECNT
ncbi:hypothetical protein DYY67_0380 [Candidatus Nitrosotalea sp. TS]|uniref:hypothetical protein n=1 Tax=Candidatus Nitrosotalea sp. TS TaxID=2341020 RepID=UPI001409B3C3|nr:hypothetical protein [Candidatus Nitrosotalea sp. TS]NHI02683.1 hypothetical protein [Candidatus Nitrosotalea sp. TS]